MMTRMGNAQSGNVLFYILIAVVLLAALSFAVSHSGRGNIQQVSAERARLQAAELLEYANDMAAGVGQLRLRGVAVTALCFDHARWGGADYTHGACGDVRNRIFDPEGAGLFWKNVPAEALDSTATPDALWHIYGDNEVQDIGTTAGDASGADLLLVADALTLSVCQSLNGLLGVTDVSDAPPVDTSYGTGFYVGGFGYSATIGDEDALLAGKTAACFQKTANPPKYVFYKVLQAR
ncbi:MAG: hypothetical protein IT559_03300 [Alphaproteobacteria bacterium]|nr:hypothetical protein [Alphaproteobacteria bacterium]